MPSESMGKAFMAELEAETEATKKCLERVPFEKLANWKPHERSMKMGQLSTVVADIPRWITYTIKGDHIDFATYDHAKIKSSEELVKHFNKSVKDAKDALKNVSDEELEKEFSLKDKGIVLMSSSKKENISSSINHMVHHRGQLAVYLRMNNIPIPAIYGPSADEKTF